MDTPLTELQSNVKKDPDLYKEIVLQHIEEYTQLITNFPENPSGPNERLGELIYFLSQISPFFVVELKHFPSQILTILDNYYVALHQEFRKTLFSSLIILRNREQIPAMSILPLCFKLFRCQDKGLRLQAFNFLISDIKKINKSSQNYKLNKQLQGFIFDMIKDSNVTAAKKSLHVVMTLYKKRVWKDSRTVNVIANACLLKEPKLVQIGCTFLLAADTDSFETDDEEDEEAPEKTIIGAKKSKGKINKREREIANYERKERRKERKIENKAPDFLTIDQINNPQGFVEEMFLNLQKTFSKAKYDLKIVMLQVIARIVGRHRLILLELYPYLQKILSPKSRRITHILIVCAEATHELVPPSDLQPLVKKLIDNFIGEQCAEETLILGLNTLREICKRQPLVVDADVLEYVAGFKNYRNKSVVVAACSIISLYKEIKPSLLKKKLRGNGEDQVGEFGEVKVFKRIPGIELLESQNDGKGLSTNQTVFLRQPIVKSDNLERLEKVLEKRKEKEDQNEEKNNQEEEEGSEEEGSEEEGSEEEGSEEEGSEEEESEEEESEEEGNEEERSEEEIEEEESQEEENEEEDSEEEEEGDEDSKNERDSEEIEEENSNSELTESENSGQESMSNEEDISPPEENTLLQGAQYLPQSNPQLPIECDRILTQKDFNRIKQLQREAEARRKHEQFVDDSESDSNPHDFLEDSDLETGQVSKQEKRKATIEEKLKRKYERKKKTGGKTHREHKKNKPALMVMKKKQSGIKEQLQQVRKKIRRSKQQLGKFSKRFSQTKKKAA
ncbi:unnamed protein product [Blepharisma stoltei]|uniref:Protein SDA1 n=1 Tax=Blepharisma stoltei TaxID=1481888 RepID=A0AAU9KJS6_9CILI|nr:unnamed protein product [Blepharisma stoltei]